MKPKTLVTWGLTGLASLALAALLAYFTRWWSAMAASIPLLSGLVGFMLLLLTTLAWGLAKIRRGASSTRINRSMLLIGFFLLLQLTYLPISQALRHAEVTRAQAYAEALIPRLETYHEQHGTYPATLDPLATGDANPPALLELHNDLPLPYDNREFYFQRGSTYSFRFYFPDGFIGYAYEYCCGPQGHWTVTD